MKNLVLIIFLIPILILFYNINELNYSKHIEIKRNFVKHPENLPKKEIAKYTSFWFKNLRADIYWLETVQYIWSNAISSEYKKYLFKILDIITELNPYFWHPYTIWELLLPNYNERYENLSEEEQELNIKQWEEIWQKWIKNLCDEEKIQKIKNEESLYKVLENEELRNPCKNYLIPYYLAYLYYFYQNKPIESSMYYKIAAANDDAPKWARVMAAIMQWKWWNREKGFFMFLNIAKVVDKENKICIDFASKLEEEWIKIFWNRQYLNWDFLYNLENIRKSIIWEYSDDKLSDTLCDNYVNKAIRELNLEYIDLWNEKYKKDHNWNNSENAKRLFEDWYIDFLPIDFQQYEGYWVIYKYNKDIDRFDYEMWKYE